MSVYVDDMRAPFGRLIMCHMIADTSAELLAMVDHIGVQRRWIQDQGTHCEHFDIALAKRALAVQHGAVEITWRELAMMLHARRRATTRANERAGDPAIVRPRANGY